MMIMRILLTVMIIMGCGSAAPLAGERESKTCSMEYVTVWEEIEEEHVNKVVCETEFREQCQEVLEEICRNEPVCEIEERMVCETSVTTKCGLEKQLVNQTYVVNECRQVEKDICEYEWIGEGENREWTPVDGSCVSKPVEECEDITKYDEVIVEQEVCREIPIEDCHVETSKVCEADATREVCDTIPKKTCEILPHEDCREITEMVPGRVSKRVAQLVCDEDNEILEDKEEDNDILDHGNEDSDVVTIDQIFGTNFNGDDDITNVVDTKVIEESFDEDIEKNFGTNFSGNDDTTEFIGNDVVDEESLNKDTEITKVVATESNSNLSTETTVTKKVSTTTEVSLPTTTLSTPSTTIKTPETTSATTAATTIKENTSTTTATTTIKETTETTKSTTNKQKSATSVSTTSVNGLSSSVSTESSSTENTSEDTSENIIGDGSRIIFSDDEINKRIDILSTRQIFKQTRITSTTKPDVERINDASSQIFFPDR